MNKTILITWDQMQGYTRELAERLLPVEQWQGIIAVSRGGLVPAAILARELGLRHVDTICISTYDHDIKREANIIKQAPGDGEGFIIIDDLVDSGSTAKIVRGIYPKAKFVTVCAKADGKRLVDDYIVDIDQDTWVKHPWDTGISFVEPLCNEK